jgi:branched-chain amino acid transport system permease protein
MTDDLKKSLALHLGFFAMLFLVQFVASDYAVLSLTRIMVLAVFAVGYNLMFGYVGLLSLGHAMFFAVGLYVAAIGATRFNISIPVAFLLAILIGAVFSTVVGAIALRANGIAFMIVTLMFSQALYLTVLYFGDYTRGDEGIVIRDELRILSFAGTTVDLTNPVLRFNLALLLLALAVAFTFTIVNSRIGRIFVAIRENETRASMLGHDVMRYKLFAVVLSGTLSAMAGAAYALMFAYAGSTLASIQYSIHPLLWTLVGGAATVLGPVIGTALMFLVVDLASSFTNANLLAVGLILVCNVVFFPKGILGTLRQKWLRWLQ